MPAWIALFRGINVGGNNKLPMTALKALLESLGCTDVRTYIQSGNVVLSSRESRAPKLARTLEHAVSAKHGIQSRVLLLTPQELEGAAKANPFPKAENSPKTLHLWFLAAPAKAPDLSALKAVQKPNEEFVLKGKVFYLHASEGIGKSKLAAKVEKALGVDATARNWNTVRALIELADS